MRRGLQIWALLTLLVLMVVAATAAHAERVVVEPAAIVAV